MAAPLYGWRELEIPSDQIQLDRKACDEHLTDLIHHHPEIAKQILKAKAKPHNQSWADMWSKPIANLSSKLNSLE